MEALLRRRFCRSTSRGRPESTGVGDLFVEAVERRRDLRRHEVEVGVGGVAAVERVEAEALPPGALASMAVTTTA
jgi:hypothetical protein